MAYQICWLVENRVLYTRFIGNFNLETLEAYVPDQKRLMASTDNMVHSISDTTRIEKTEVNLKMLQTFTKTLHVPANVGWHVDVIPTVVNRMIASITTQFAQVRSRQFGTLEEAVNFLQVMDQTLPLIDLSVLDSLDD